MSACPTLQNDITCGVCGCPVESGPLQRCAEADMYHCRRCDVVFSHPMVNPGRKWYEEFQVCHKIAAPEQLSWDHKMFFKDVPLSAGRTVLDIGCGAGYFLAEARTRGFGVAGMDFDSNAVAIGRAKLGLDNLFCGSLDEYLNRHPHRQFDLVTFFAIFEHLDKPIEFLKDIGRLLKPDGNIVFTVPYRDRRPNFGNKEWWDQPPFHLTRWSKKAIINVLAETGFEPLDIIVGRSQDDDVVDWLKDRIFKPGLVTDLVHEAEARTDDREKSRLMKKARTLARVSAGVRRCLRIPIAAALTACGATGKTMYIRAKRTDRCR